MKSLTHEQLMQLTLLPTVDGNLVGVDRDDAQPSDLIPVGIVRKEFANLLASASNMYRILTATIEGNERLLQIIESEGLDLAAHHLTQLIAAMKLVQKSAIDGPDVLTGFKPTAK